MLELNKIYNMDCLEGMGNIPDKSVDVSFTSPPYNRIRNDTYDFYDDTKEDYYKFLTDVTDELLRVTKGYCIVNIQCNHFNKSEFYRFLGNYHNKINGVVVWSKTNPQPSNNYNKIKNTRSVTNGFEYFVFIKDGKEFVTYGKEQFINTIQSSVNSKHFKGHGAIMKKEICDLIIGKFTKENDIVLDPFMGSGTTALSCINKNVNYIGYEISKEYCDIANKRISEEMAQIKLF